jgi:hypothetical protein
MIKKYTTESGQTLVETMVALVVLVTGISASLALANFAFKTSTNITKQLIAIGIAREGVEAVKNMRDTNWLNGTLDSTCYDFRTSAQTANCYRDWLFVSGFYDLMAPGGKSFALSGNPFSSQFWELVPQSSDFSLSYDSSASSGLYKASTGTPSGYFRKLILTEEATSPYYDKDTGPRLKLTVQVWWKDKNCPAVTAAVFPSNGSCRVQLETYFTNWKNY